MPDETPPNPSQAQTPARLALLGTGIMGGHMARRLVQAGHDLTVWNRSAEKAHTTGARLAESPGHALESADIAIVMLSNAQVIEEILFGRAQAARSLRPGAILVVMSSIPPDVCRAQRHRLAGQAVGYVDAPVSGGESGARDGTLAILGGGAHEDVARIAHVMRPLGTLTHLGPVGSGQLAKLANQIIVGGTMIAVAEALNFAAAGGADPAALQRALQGGFADSPILRQHGARMVQGDFKPGSPAMYQLKDMRAAAAFADTIGFAPSLLPHLIALFGAMEQQGEAQMDVSAVYNEIARRAGRR